jgi:site-specific DNA recombinase
VSVRAAIYARSSTRGQTERQTTLYQVEACRAFAQAQGYEVVAELVDESTSGRVPMIERLAGNEVVELATRGLCDVVLVFRFDRIARNSADLISTDRVLRAAGTNLLSVAESDSAEDEDPLTSFGDFAERELVAISQRMSVGRDRVARDGRWMGGPIPFGYDQDEHGRLVPSEREVGGMPEAELARTVFERIAAGSSTVAEARRLDSLGVFPGRRYSRHDVIMSGGRWQPSRINAMVRNTLYTGRHVFNSRYGAIEREVVPLVDARIWEQVQATLITNRGVPSGFPRRAYVLRGLVVCANCGCGFGGTPTSSGHWRDYYYRCNGWLAAVHPIPDERCRAKHIPADWLETLVWEQCIAVDTSLSTEVQSELRRAAIERIVRVIHVTTTREGRNKAATITVTYTDGRQSKHEFRRRRRRRR